MTLTPAARPTFGVVVLTMGTRPDDLQRGLASLLAQQDVACDIVVVGNSWEPTGLPDGVRGVHLPENVGIPAGRNAGVPFEPRVVDATGLPSPRRWVPRLRVGNPLESGPATALWEGAVAMPRDVFEQTGGWPDEFFYAHEGIDLVWRVWDAGRVPWYAADLVAHHPVIDPARHDVYYRLNARNRVWLARRNLPVALEPLYVGTWVGMTLLRVHDRAALSAWFTGLREGLTERPSGRRRMSWGTVWQMSRAGRPPVI